MANTIKIKRGLKANLPTLEIGEQAYCTDTNELFIGTATGNKLINEDTDISQLSNVGDVEFTNLAENDILLYDGNKWVNGKGFEPNPFAIFTDTSGSPGSATPINDLDGNLMADLDKGIAYYGTVSHTDLYTSDELASEVGITEGTGSSDASIDNEVVWHKYYWNGGIHFYRKPVRNNVSWNSIAAEGAVYGTGTTTSRKGHSGTNVSQNAELTKNGVTYAVRLMEGSTLDPTDDVFSNPSPLHGSEYNLILLNLHAATNSGSYSNSPTDGVSYNNWEGFGSENNYTNEDFVGWKTNFGDNDLNNFGSSHWQQEAITGNTGSRLLRIFMHFADAYYESSSLNLGNVFWAPVLTVKHSSFTYE